MECRERPPGRGLKTPERDHSGHWQVPRGEYHRKLSDLRAGGFNENPFRPRGDNDGGIRGADSSDPYEGASQIY